MKTIREILEFTKVPTWVTDRDEEAPVTFFALGIAPDGWAIGWNVDGTNNIYQADAPYWVIGSAPGFTPEKAVT
jgi:hypothetical protein